MINVNCLMFNAFGIVREICYFNTARAFVLYDVKFIDGRSILTHHEAR